MTVVDLCWSQGFPGELAQVAIERGISRYGMQGMLSSSFALPAAAVMIGLFLRTRFCRSLVAETQ